MEHTELFNRGIDELMAGRFDEAKRLFAENEERAGTASQTRDILRQAETNLAAGNLDAGAMQLNTVLEFNPTIPEAYLGLTRVALFTGQLDDASLHAMAAVKVAPQLGLSWTMLGLVHEAKAEVEDALQNLEVGAQLGAEVFLCQFNFGRVLASAGRAGEGIPFLIRATELESKNPAGFMILGIAQMKLNQLEKAIKAFEKVKDIAPKSLDGWATLADVFFEAKRFDAARATLDNGLVAVGDHPALLEKAIACAMKLDDTKGAIAYVERELAVAPHHEQSWLNLASLSLLAGNLDRSEQAARELIKLNPQNWEAWFHLGNLFDAMPDEAKAEDAYRNALNINGDSWKVLMNLATLLVQTTVKSKHEEAKDLLYKAKEFAPHGEWRVHYNLALAHARLGETKEALELAREIQTRAPANDQMFAEAKKLDSNLLDESI